MVNLIYYLKQKKSIKITANLIETKEKEEIIDSNGNNGILKENGDEKEEEQEEEQEEEDLESLRLNALKAKRKRSENYFYQNNSYENKQNKSKTKHFF